MTHLQLDVARMTHTEPRYLNINEASKACGLSPSVLRIWELRYGWPNPKRRENGYRAYGPHLVEDLKRMSKLVKSGMPIRQCIEDGMPRWPLDATQLKPRTIDQTRSLPRPRSSEAAQLQRSLVDAIERHQAGLMREYLERVIWSARPDDEVIAALVPTVVGIAELRHVQRSLGPIEQSTMSWVANRAMQLMRRYRCTGELVHVVPTASEHGAFSCVVALVLRQRGINAEPWMQDGRPRGRMVLAGEPSAEAHLPHIVALASGDDHGIADCTTIAALLEREQAPII